jgi:transcriptional regulator with XRE-family HTH domain
MVAKTKTDPHKRRREQLDREIAQRLRETREAMEYRRTDVAKMLRISVTRYSNYEEAVRGIPFHLLVDWAKIAAVSCDFLLTGKVTDTDRAMMERITDNVGRDGRRKSG